MEMMKYILFKMTMMLAGVIVGVCYITALMASMFIFSKLITP